MIRNVVLLFAILIPGAYASTVVGNISGTCGFYQGSLSNVVYSQNFNGPADGTGTYCTGFLPGGSVTPNATVSAGDISAYANHSTDASAPAGYGVFIDFTATVDVTQEYVISADSTGVDATSPTGTVLTFLQTVGGTDDGSGQGSCYPSTSVSLGGQNSNTNNGGDFTFPITFGQPFAATEQATVTCNDYGIGSFGDGGMRQAFAGEFLVTDSNGVFLGNAVPTSIPEPSTSFLIAIALVFCWGLHRRFKVENSLRLVFVQKLDWHNSIGNKVVKPSRRVREIGECS